ncbi:uncharacterized protein LOC112494681 isoform X1 [Cephus cinctus]|uniref:Uncharacterized protein LOC112494681 isoform X1 n=1 Tax=Cephus cinctus TaxID=211228 RepID=A0AAJ7W3N6_CEPCN|nr:uncharacterized protein LOC112494681 isoform X1 [Cephus cinctus]
MTDSIVTKIHMVIVIQTSFSEYSVELMRIRLNDVNKLSKSLSIPAVLFTDRDRYKWEEKVMTVAVPATVTVAVQSIHYFYRSINFDYTICVLSCLSIIVA